MTVNYNTVLQNSRFSGFHLYEIFLLNKCDLLNFFQMHQTRVRLSQCGEAACRGHAAFSICTKCNISNLLIFVQRLEACNCLNGNHQLHCYIPFTDQAKFNPDGINSKHDSHMLSDETPQATVESDLQLHFSVIAQCAGLANQLTGLFVFEGCLTYVISEARLP